MAKEKGTNEGMKEKALPEVVVKPKKVPAAKTKEKDIPNVGNPENMVKIGEQMIEIKPTKLKYHRNNTAYFYRFVETVALPDIMALPAGTFGDGRDGDQALMEWLIAATDDVDLIRENYDEMDTETIEKILQIFKRVNKIEEKELRQKNAAPQTQTA